MVENTNELYPRLSSDLWTHAHIVHMCTYTQACTHIFVHTYTGGGVEKREKEKETEIDFSSIRQESSLKLPLRFYQKSQRSSSISVSGMWAAVDPWKNVGILAAVMRQGMRQDPALRPRAHLRSEACQWLCFLPLGMRKSKCQRNVTQLFRLPMVSPRFVLSLAQWGLSLQGWSRTFVMMPVGWDLSSMKHILVRPPSKEWNAIF